MTDDTTSHPSELQTNDTQIEVTPAVPPDDTDRAPSAIDPGLLPRYPEVPECAPPPPRELMPPELRNMTDFERTFAQAYYEVSMERGDAGSAQIAYRRAFPNTSLSIPQQRNYASALLKKNARIQAMINWLRQNRGPRQMVLAERVVTEIERIAFFNILDVMTPDGNIDLTNADFVNAAGIAEVIVEEETKILNSTKDEDIGITEPDIVTTKKVRIKTYNKLQALIELAKIHKLYHTLFPEDLERMIRDARQSPNYLPAPDEE